MGIICTKYINVDWNDDGILDDDKTFKCSINFTYDKSEGSPLDGAEVNTANEAIRAVRRELEELSCFDFILIAILIAIKDSKVQIKDKYKIIYYAHRF